MYFLTGRRMVAILMVILEFLDVGSELLRSCLCGYIQVNDTEAVVAKNALFLRHPEMADWPSDHDWFFAKMNITQVWVLDYFGGVKTVTPEDYYNAKPYKLHLGKSAMKCPLSFCDIIQLWSEVYIHSSRA